MNDRAQLLDAEFDHTERTEVDAELVALSAVHRPCEGSGEDRLASHQRDPEAVKEQVLDEYVRIEAAQERYGVVLKGSPEECDVEVDLEATRSLREKVATERGVVAGGRGDTE